MNKRLCNLISRKIKRQVPLIGCASHRLNLACQEFYADKMDLIEKVDFLMKDLKTLKNSAKLRKYTQEKPERRNATR